MDFSQVFFLCCSASQPEFSCINQECQWLCTGTIAPLKSLSTSHSVVWGCSLHFSQHFGRLLVNRAGPGSSHLLLLQSQCSAFPSLPLPISNGACTNKKKQRRILTNLWELQGIPVTVIFMFSFWSQVRKVLLFIFWDRDRSLVLLTRPEFNARSKQSRQLLLLQLEEELPPC